MQEVITQEAEKFLKFAAGILPASEMDSICQGLRSVEDPG